MIETMIDSFLKRGKSSRMYVQSALGELRTLASLAQAHFLSLYFTSIAGKKSCPPHRNAQALIVLDQRARDTVTDGARLARVAATANGYLDVDLVGEFGNFKRLPHDHACGLTTEILIQRMLVDGDIAAT
jgi:hypothetical protein